MTSNNMNFKGDKTMKRILEQLELSPSLFRDLKMKRRKLSDYMFNDSESVVSADSGISGVSSCTQDSSPNSSSCSVSSPGGGNDNDNSGDGSDGKDSISSYENDGKYKSGGVPRDQSLSGSESGQGSDSRDERRGNSPQSDQGDPESSGEQSQYDVSQEEITRPRDVTEAADLGSSGYSDYGQMNPFSESGQVSMTDQTPPSSAGFTVSNMTSSIPSGFDLPTVKEEQEFSGGEYSSDFNSPDDERSQGSTYQKERRYPSNNPIYNLPVISTMPDMIGPNGVPKMTCSTFPPGMPWAHATTQITKQGNHGNKSCYNMDVPVVSAVPAVALSSSSGQMMTFPILNVNFREGDNNAKELILLNASGVPCGKVAEITKQESQVIGTKLALGGVLKGMENGSVPSMSFEFQTDSETSGRKPQNGRGTDKNVTLDWSYLSEVQRLQAEQIKGNKEATMKEESQDDGEALTCDICNDRATGLHYGIITCEGCKGFFKRTVQNKRVYTCGGNGNCVINKAQRNRCQFCRFKKCMEKGMILAAVREDRMPGGRNSGAIYNAYKVKYKRQKKREESRANVEKQLSPSSRDVENTYAQRYNGRMIGTNYPGEGLRGGGQLFIPPPSPQSPVSPGGGTWGRTSSFSPVTSTAVRYSQSQTTSQSRSSPSTSVSSKDMASQVTSPSQWVWPSPAATQGGFMNSLNYLLQCEKQDSVMLYRLPMTMTQDISQILGKLADDIVCELVVWMKKLPMYSQLNSATRTNILATKWHELLVLSTSVHHAEINMSKNNSGTLLPAEHLRSEPLAPILAKQIERKVKSNIDHLHHYLTTAMKQEVTLQQLYQDLGDLVEKITVCMHIFEVLRITKEEFVCLKTILLLNQVESQIDARAIHEARTQQIELLRCFLRLNFPDQPNRFMELMYQLPRIRDSADILLKNRLIYIPFLFNSVFNWQ